MIVRKATASDYDVMVDLVIQFFKENDLSYLCIDIDIVSAGKLVSYVTDKHLMLVLTTDDGEIVGGVGGLLTTFLFNNETKLFQQIFFYVSEDYRKHSKFLLDSLTKTCKSINLDNIIMGYISDSKLDKLERFYKIQGFKKFETQFIKRIKKRN